jgi:outer membrane protein OmpA-like peptidoglycan-associated protein
MFDESNQEDKSYWVSFADLFSGFMVVFIAISLLSIGMTKKEDEEKPHPGSKPPMELKYAEMVDNFRKRIANGDLEGVEIADSATIRFYVKSGTSDKLFEDGKSVPTAYFDRLLFKFIPVYIDELYKLYKVNDKVLTIKEIRIEGHTDSRGGYQSNLELSSNRALEVHKKLFIVDSFWKKYPANFLEFVQSKSISCGYSYSKRLDQKGNYISVSGQKEDYDKSRRVEFRIFLAYKDKNK